jgi:hypothetical protein
MVLQVGELRGHAEVEDLDSVKSPHTHRMLRRATVSVEVDPRVEDMFDEAVPGEVIDGDDVVFRARVKQKSWSDDSDRRYVLELTELEGLEPSELVIGGLPVVPYRFTEEVHASSGAIIIECRVAVDAEAQSRLLDLLSRGREYFDVIRHGIEDEPRRMRFGHCFWSEAESGSAKHQLLLVEDLYDDHGDGLRSPDARQPQLGNALRKVAMLEATIETLLDHFGDDVLDQAARESIRAVAKDRADRVELELYKVADVDEWEMRQEKA